MEEFVSLKEFGSDYVEPGDFSKDSSHHARASNNKKRKHEEISADSDTPWTRSIDWESYQSATEQLTAEIKAFTSYILPSEEEHQLRSSVIDDIRHAITSRWPDSSVEAFGSFKTGLYLPTGMTRSVPKSNLLALGALLRAKKLAKDLIVIWKARVPIVKFRSTRGDFAVDISINQTSGIDAGPTVRNLIRNVGEEASRSLIMVIKAFLVQRGLHEVYSGGLSSYSVICLVVSFLQLHPRLQKKQMRASANLGVMLLEFLELYGKHFNFDRTGIMLRNRGGYFDKASKGWVRERQPFLLSIEDPQDSSNDISCGSHNILTVRQHFSGAYDMLCSEMTQRASTLFNETASRKRHTMQHAGSLLGSIITLPPEVISRRLGHGPLPPKPRSSQSDTTSSLAKPLDKSAPVPANRDGQSNSSSSSRSKQVAPESRPKSTSQQSVTREQSTESKETRTKDTVPNAGPDFIVLDSDSDSLKSDADDETSRYAIGQPKKASKQSADASDSDSSVEMIQNAQKSKSQVNSAKRQKYWQSKKAAPGSRISLDSD